MKMFKFIKFLVRCKTIVTTFLILAPTFVSAKDFIVHKGCGKITEVQNILKFKIVSSNHLCEINKYSIPVSNSLNCVELTDSQIFAANLNCDFDQPAFRCESTYGCLLKKKAGKITKIIEKIKREGKLSHLKQKRNPPRSRFNYRNPKKLKKFGSFQEPSNLPAQTKKSEVKRIVASEQLLKEETNISKENKFFQKKKEKSESETRQIAISLDD